MYNPGMSASHEITVRDLIADIGRQEIISACGVKTQAVTNWIAEGRIPAQHYFPIRDLCDGSGITVPEHLFRSAAA